MADYQCYPLWEYDDFGLVGNLSPESLPISQSLRDRLDFWSNLYEATLCIDDPVKSGFGSSEKEFEFKIIGEDLAKDLRDELGERYEVIY